MAEPYDPQPPDLGGVDLPAELLDLVEVLAEQVHEVWARGRLDDGWTWGPERSDETHEHPCLVPYDELPEGERDYDRRTALGTIRAILARGYTIVPP